MELVLIEDIDVTVVDAKLDGGISGTGIMIEDSSYAWLYPMDVTGNIGLYAKNSEVSRMAEKSMLIQSWLQKLLPEPAP